MKYLVILFCLFAQSTFAAANYAPTEDNTGIVTPNVATSAMWTQNYTLDSNGDIVVCPSYADYHQRNVTCLTPDGKNAWKRMQDMVPRNRTYVGFRIVSASYGYRQLEIYYK